MSKERWDKTDLVIGVIIGIMLTLGCAHLVYEFNHNLFRLTVTMHSSNTEDDIELNIHQKTLIYAIVKQTVLACWSSLFLVVYAISFVIFTFIIPPSNISDMYIYEQWVFCMGDCELTMIIALSFAVNSKMYEKLCASCHSECDVICQSKATQFRSFVYIFFATKCRLHQHKIIYYVYTARADSLPPKNSIQGHSL